LPTETLLDRYSAMSSHFVAPQSPLKWDHTPESILKLAKESIDVSKARQDDIAHLKPAEYSFQTVFQALALSQTELDHVADPIAFYQNVSTSKELRDASNEAESLIREYEVESSMRIDVYEVVQRTAEIMKENGEFEKLGAEEKRLAEKIILDGRRAGLSLPTEAREELKNVSTSVQNDVTPLIRTHY
jgi:Zn-dependent oligopeptidase